MLGYSNIGFWVKACWGEFKKIYAATFFSKEDKLAWINVTLKIQYYSYKMENKRKTSSKKKSENISVVIQNLQEDQSCKFMLFVTELWMFPLFSSLALSLLTLIHCVKSNASAARL